MDSLTQIVLGASVGEAVLGKKAGNKAMLWGAIAGTIPDLDVFFDNFFQPIDGLYIHRGFSHSIVFAFLLAPVLGYLIHRIHRKKRPQITFKNWSTLVFWSTVTHPLLDMMTNWGTQLFWPFDYRIAINNIFVLDPLYTLPFLTFLIIAATKRKNNPRRSKINRMGLIISSLYLILTMNFKLFAHNNLKKHFENNGLNTELMMTKPMPLTSFYWTGTTKNKGSFHVGYYSIFSGVEDKIIEVEQNDELLGTLQIKNSPLTKRLKYLTNGFYTIRQDSSGIYMEDLRFGLLSGFNSKAPHIGLFKYKMLNQEGKWDIKRDRNESDEMFKDFSLYWYRVFGIKPSKTKE